LVQQQNPVAVGASHCMIGTCVKNRGRLSLWIWPATTISKELWRDCRDFGAIFLGVIRLPPWIPHNTEASGDSGSIRNARKTAANQLPIATRDPFPTSIN
jgi:hypothetical protein